MRYPPAWKGKLKVDGQGVWWRGERLGVVAQHQAPPGTKTPGGMNTSVLFEAQPFGGEYKKFTTMTQALDYMITLERRNANDRVDPEKKTAGVAGVR